MTNADRRFPQHTLDSAPQAAHALMTGTQKMFGFIPSPMGRMVTQPKVAQAFVQMNAVWETTSLTPLEREVVVMVVAYENQCHYCVAMHSAAMAADGVSPGLMTALRTGETLSDGRLESLARFSRALLRGRGDVSPDEWRQFTDAGFDHAAALEVVLGIATYTLSTFANRLTQAPLDAVFEQFRWTPTQGLHRAAA